MRITNANSLINIIEVKKVTMSHFMYMGDKFYSKNLGRLVHPGEEIYLDELKKKLEEEISFYKSTGCGTAGCNPIEQFLRNELKRIQNILD